MYLKMCVVDRYTFFVTIVLKVDFVLMWASSWNNHDHLIFARESPVSLHCSWSVNQQLAAECYGWETGMLIYSTGAPPSKLVT